jgi:CBS domain containing-hemolysin-like protein
MALLISYVLIALVFSFLCSIAEAVLLSVTAPYVAVLEKQGKPSGALLRQLKTDINKPLAAILTLNTIAHTITWRVSCCVAIYYWPKPTATSRKA